jgi:beta-glucosidase
MKTPIISILAFATTVFAAARAARDGDWTSAYTKAEAALAKLTQVEKINPVAGVGWEKGPCVGSIAALSSIGFPALCLRDPPLECASA